MIYRGEAFELTIDEYHSDYIVAVANTCKSVGIYDSRYSYPYTAPIATIYVTSNAHVEHDYLGRPLIVNDNYILDEGLDLRIRTPYGEDESVHFYSFDNLGGEFLQPVYTDARHSSVLFSYDFYPA